MYAKGGSAYILFANNVVYNCGESGIAAGQGTGGGQCRTLGCMLGHGMARCTVCCCELLPTLGAGPGLYCRLRVYDPQLASVRDI